MISKCFLYIDGYPKNADDVPFDLQIDWGDGSVVEEYLRLQVEKVPQTYHLYNDMLPHEISVTITNACGSAVRTVQYAPFVPAESSCLNFYNLNPSEVLADFSDVAWELGITGYFTDVTQVDADHVAARLVTDVSTNLPLVTFPPLHSELPSGTFDASSQVVDVGAAVENLNAHLGNQWVPDESDIVPKMTGSNAPLPYVVSASMEGYYGQSWNAFDQTHNPDFWANVCWSTPYASPSASNPVWLKIDLGTAKKIAGYSLECLDSQSYYGLPKTWKLFGSNDTTNTNDSGTWAEIDSQADITDWSPDSSKTDTKSFPVDVSAAYRWYKLVVTDIYEQWGYSNDGGVCLKGMQLFAAGGATVVKGAEVEFLYTFNPTHVDRIVLTGDLAFKNRVDDIVLTQGSPEANLSWADIGDGMFEVTVPVNRTADTLRLSLATGIETVYASIKIYLNQTALISSQQDITVNVRTFLTETSAMSGIPLEDCEKGSSVWTLSQNKWQAKGNASGQQILRIPLPYTGAECWVDLDLRWNLACSSFSPSVIYFYLANLNDAVPSSNEVIFMEYGKYTDAAPNSGSRTITLHLHGETENILPSDNFVNLVMEIDPSRSVGTYDVELLGLRMTLHARNKIAAGMSGSLLYQSEQSRKISRIDIVCDANARARMTNEGFSWEMEDLGAFEAWRGIKLIADPIHINEFAFDFSGTDSSNNVIGEGLIYSTHFYEIAAQTDYDLPINVDFAVNIDRNKPEGIFYYIDDNGKHHCVSVREVRFTQSELDHLAFDPATVTTLQLDTEHGHLSYLCSGSVNTACLQNPQPPAP